MCNVEAIIQSDLSPILILIFSSCFFFFFFILLTHLMQIAHMHTFKVSYRM